MNKKFQTVVFLVRHGQTDRVYSLDANIDNQRVLAEVGERQMEKVGEYLQSFSPSALYTSPRYRTMQCAHIIKERAKIETAITERDELMEVYTDIDYTSLEARLIKLFKEIVATHEGEQVVCVTHQDVIRGALRAVEAVEVNIACDMADVYRLVFAGDVFVECSRQQPARAQ
jgi:broad specificity phosphatase PhoE